MARSKCVPDFFRSEGLKFTVILSGGKTNSLVSSADFVLSLASWISEPAKPTTAKPGNPFVNVASTSITLALTPSSVAEVSLLTIVSFFCLTFMGLCFGGVPLSIVAFIVSV